MGAKEQIVMWGSVLLVIIVIGLIVTSGGENNYLNPSGNRNPANQKLMVVDQDTGEISFIQKSLQGVNAQIVADDSVILKKLEDLERWNGDRSREIKALQDNYATKTYVNGELAKKQAKGSYQGAGNYIRSGDRIAIAHKNDTGCGSGAGCRAFTNFKKQGNGNVGASLESGWKDADMHFGHGVSSDIKIHRV